MRMAVELGVDALKVAPPANVSDLEPLLEDFTDDVSVLIAGGALKDEGQLFDLTRHALRFGAAGLCVGRNVFQRATPSAALDQLENVIRLSERGTRKRS